MKKFIPLLLAVAPMTLRAPSRSPLYNSGCRVATLLVSKGVMGFLGDLRGRNSKSPPNPLGLAERVNSFHRCGGPPPSRREVWREGNRELAEYRRARDARPYNVAENCNCEMRLQRWVASLQRSDVFATVGCTDVPRRGAHCAPVYPRCYNTPSRGRAKGDRGDRKAPISYRRQGRRP